MADTYEQWLRERTERSTRIRERLDDDATRDQAIVELADLETENQTWEARQRAEAMQAEFTRAQEISVEATERAPDALATRDHATALRSALTSATAGEIELDFSHVQNELRRAAEGWTARDLATRAQDTTVAGVTIPTDLERQAYMKLLAVPGVRQAGATVMPTSAGNEKDIPVPTPPAKRTSGQITAEGATAPNEDMTWGEVKLRAYKYNTSMEFTEELLEDTAIPIERIMGRSFGHTLGSLMNEAYTKNDGSSKPKGIAHGLPAAQTVTATADDKISLQDVQKLFASMPVGYIDENAPGDSSFGPIRQGLVWMVHPLVWAHIVGREGTDGHPVFQAATNMNTRTILGFPTVFNVDFNSGLTTGEHVMTIANFADFYIIRDVGSMTIAWSPHIGIKEGKIYYKATVRTDGQIQDANAARHLVLA